MTWAIVGKLETSIVEMDEIKHSLVYFKLLQHATDLRPENVCPRIHTSVVKSRPPRGDVSNWDVLPKQARVVQSERLQQALKIRQCPRLPVRLRRGGAAARVADALRVIEGDQDVRGELRQAVQTQVDVNHIRRPFVELGHALRPAQHPGGAAVRQRQFGLGQRRHGGHLAVSRLLGLVAARYVLKVVHGRVLVRHVSLVLQHLYDQALVGVGVGEHLLVVRDLPQLADVRGVTG